MFDIGFWELVLVGVVALLVVGPERLPGLARTAGMWIGRARYFMNNIQADINREIKADELKRILEEQARISDDLVNEARWSFTESDTNGIIQSSTELNANNISATTSDTLDYHPGQEPLDPSGSSGL